MRVFGLTVPHKRNALRLIGMTYTQTTAEDMCNTMAWLIRRRWWVNDRDVFEKSAIVVVVVAVVVSSVVGSAVIVVVVSVRGIRECADIVLWLPLLLLMLAAATGCYSSDDHDRNGAIELVIGVLVLRLGIGIRCEIVGPCDGGAVCRHGRAPA